MIHNDIDMLNWKKEEINYYRNYLKNFDESSPEYKRIVNGISELESMI